MTALTVEDRLRLLDEEPDDHGARPADTTARAEVLRLRLLSIDDLAKLPQPVPLVDEILWSNTLACVYGKPGSAKTLLVLDWALCVATGSRWLNHHVRRARVLWVAAEGAEGLHKRISAWRAERQAGPITKDWFAAHPSPINLFETDQAGALAELAVDDGYGLVVIDTLARSSLGAEENSAKDMGLVIAAADEIRRRSGAAVVLVHHTARSGESPRGSSAIDGAAYSMWRTEVEADDVVRIVNEKAKETAKTPQVRLQLVPRLDSVVLHRSTGAVDALGSGAGVLLRVLAELDAGKGIPTGLWLRSCGSEGVAERSFYRWQKGLEGQGFTANLGTDKRPLWTLTDLGKRAAENADE